MKRTMIVVCVASLLVWAVGAGKPAMSVRVITEDLPRFWVAYDLAKAESDMEKQARIFETDYLKAGSKALKVFNDSRIEGGRNLARSVMARQRYFDALRPTVEEVARSNSIAESVRPALARIAEWIPGAKFPDTHLVIGRLSSGGTTSRDAVLIGLELFGADSGAPTDELSDWEVQNIRPMSALVFTIIHEYVHTVQPRAKRWSRLTLLNAAVREGACDFVASLALDQVPDHPRHAFGLAHERDLWLEFRDVMHSKEWGDWLYTQPQRDGRPADLAYFIGYRICEAYYNRTEDKAAAVRAIIAGDGADLLVQSGYGSGF